MTVLKIFVFDEIAVVESDIFQVAIVGLVDLRSLFSVVAALASGVIQYAEGRGFLNQKGE